MKARADVQIEIYLTLKMSDLLSMPGIGLRFCPS
jgi:hypothetical protein